MVAQVVQAGQCVAEERLLKKINIPGTLIVAYEGIWGCITMLLIVFPLMSILPGDDAQGEQENTIDTLTMINNSTQLQIMLGIYLVSCSTYNVARMLVTSTLSAVHFTMIDASRTALIWALDLYIKYYGAKSIQEFGEDWTPYSPLQAVGFCLLIFGQTIYGGIVQLPIPSLYPDEAELRSFVESQMFSPATRHMATPLPPFSPPQGKAGDSKDHKQSWPNLGQMENPFDMVKSPN